MYKYYNQFHMTNELAQTITSIINQNEGADYLCKAISVTIPKHKGLVFSSPLNDYNPWGGGLNALSGAQIHDINEKYGKYVEGNIPAEEYDFIAVMENNAYQAFSKLSFRSEDEIKRALETLTVMFVKYYGTFDSNVFNERFPYLEDFFASIDEWRAETGRITIDSDVLQQGYKKVLSRSRQNVKNQ